VIGIVWNPQRAANLFFLDDMGECPEVIQVKLLSALDDALSARWVRIRRSASGGEESAGSRWSPRFSRNPYTNYGRTFATGSGSFPGRFRRFGKEDWTSCSLPIWRSTCRVKATGRGLG